MMAATAASSSDSRSEAGVGEAPSTLQLFLKSSLEELARVASKAGEMDVEDSCARTLNSLNKLGRNDTSYIVPLLQGMRSSKKTLVPVALDGVHKLVSFGLLDGNLPGSTSHSSLLADDIVLSAVTSFQLNDERIHLQLVKTLVALVTSHEFPVHDNSLLEAFRTCYHIVLIAKSPDTQSAAKAALLQMLDTVFQMFYEPDFTDFENESEEHLSVTLRDGLQIFRALCKLAERGHNSRITAAYIQNKVLALELLQSILQTYPSVVGSNLFFISTMKKHLIRAVLQCVLDKIPVLFQHSLNVMLVLFEDFRLVMRNELAMFFNNFFVLALSGRKSQVAEKILVLQILSKVSEDKDILCDVFLGIPPENASQDELEEQEELKSDLAKNVEDMHHILQDVLGLIRSPADVPDKDLLARVVELMQTIMTYFHDEELDSDTGLHRSATMHLGKPVDL